MATTDFNWQGSELIGAQRDAAAALIDLFTSYGLGSLAPVIVNYLKQDYAPDTVSVLLQNTPQYKARFAANDVRMKKGLPALSPAEYLATERAYRQTLMKWGLPSGFYDSTTDFQKFLENDISPAELDQRAQSASDFINQASPQDMAFYKQYYTSGDLVAFALDPNRAAPLVGKAFQAAEIGGSAMQQGININQQQAEQLAALGVTQNDALSGFGAIAGEKPTIDKLGQIYGGGLTTQELIDATFKASGDAQTKLKKLSSKERAAFGGSSGVTSDSLSQNGGGQL